MIIRSERDIADHVAAGRLDPEDAAAVHTFATFLREHAAAKRGNGADRDAWRARWRGYIDGTADGPATPDTPAGCAVSPDDPQSPDIPEGVGVDG